MTLGGVLCALLLAILADVWVVGERAPERSDARWVSAVQEPQRRSSLSASLPGRQERLIGVHEPSAHGHLELPRPTSKPPPLHQRSEPRLGPPLGTEAQLTARTRMYLSCVLPSRHGRIADRPVVANCPAQGPPWTL
ncbi:MAG TPA: hypothetical protein VLQ93_00680 [Myxococcaceae bacterium]|nr:hypothetical protein [Myxococcaceae bacterium]